MSKHKNTERYNTIFKYMNNTAIDKTVDSYDVGLLDLLEVGSRQLARYLKDIFLEYPEYIKETGRAKRKAYKLIKPIHLLRDEFEQLLIDNKNTHKIYDVDFEEPSGDHYSQLYTAVNNHEYRDITMLDGKRYVDAKCLRLVFVENNWYIAFVDNTNLLQLSRIFFIKTLHYSAQKISYQPATTKKHLAFLEHDLQNAMTLYGKPKQKATLKALPSIAKYFEKDMKNFLSTQDFVNREEDGSVLFTVEYTQELEILPFIQKWMPDLLIVSPLELQVSYTHKLKRALHHHSV